MEADTNTYCHDAESEIYATAILPKTAAKKKTMIFFLHHGKTVCFYHLIKSIQDKEIQVQKRIHFLYTFRFENKYHKMVEPKEYL